MFFRDARAKIGHFNGDPGSLPVGVDRDLCRADGFVRFARRPAVTNGIVDEVAECPLEVGAITNPADAMLHIDTQFEFAGNNLRSVDLG